MGVEATSRLTDALIEAFYHAEMLRQQVRTQLHSTQLHPIQFNSSQLNSTHILSLTDPPNYIVSYILYVTPTLN